MPILSEFRRQFVNSPSDEQLAVSCDETLISDARSGLRPIQIVEHKFGAAFTRETEWQGEASQNSRRRFQ